MGVPTFDSEGHLPRGRYSCNLDEFEERFVTSETFVSSDTRSSIFADFLSAMNLLKEFSSELIESIWCGGGFTSAKPNPKDIDITVIVNSYAFNSLSESNQLRLRKLLNKGGFKELGLKVDGFFMTRDQIANPWLKGSEVSEEVTPYLSKRGAWDDWWSRVRVYGAEGQKPVVEDATPRRGYVEVIIDG